MSLQRHCLYRHLSSDTSSSLSLDASRWLRCQQHSWDHSFTCLKQSSVRGIPSFLAKVINGQAAEAIKNTSRTVDYGSVTVFKFQPWNSNSIQLLQALIIPKVHTVSGLVCSVFVSTCFGQWWFAIARVLLKLAHPVAILFLSFLDDIR